MDTIDVKIIDSIVERLFTAMEENACIYLIGNGGSAAIIEHAQCDLSKGLMHDRTQHENFKKLPRVFALTSPSTLLSAIMNDLGHENMFSWQINHRLEKRDVLIAVSSSGNSPNILNGAIAAKNIGSTVIGFAGFSNPELKNLSDLMVHIPSKNYGVIEDIHSMTFHAIAQQLRSKISK